MTETSTTVAFLDLAQSTTYAEVHGDAAAVDILDRFFDVVTDALDGQARLVKTLGDGVLLAASSPADGIAVATRVLTGFHDHDGLPEVAGGLHHGPVIERNGDTLGRTVNLASRLSDAAPAAALWVTDLAARAAADAGHGVEPVGPTTLPGVPDPVEVFAVAPCDHDQHRTVTDPVCGMRIVPGATTPHLDADDHRHRFCAQHCQTLFLADPHRYHTVAPTTRRDQQ